MTSPAIPPRSACQPAAVYVMAVSILVSGQRRFRGQLALKQPMSVPPRARAMSLRDRGAPAVPRSLVPPIDRGTAPPVPPVPQARPVAVDGRLARPDGEEAPTAIQIHLRTGFFRSDAPRPAARRSGEQAGADAPPEFAARGPAPRPPRPPRVLPRRRDSGPR